MVDMPNMQEALGSVPSATKKKKKKKSWDICYDLCLDSHPITKLHAVPEGALQRCLDLVCMGLGTWVCDYQISPLLVWHSPGYD